MMDWTVGRFKVQREIITTTQWMVLSQKCKFFVVTDFTYLKISFQVFKIRVIPAVWIHHHILLHPLRDRGIAVSLCGDSSYHHFLSQFHFNPTFSLVWVGSVTGRPARYVETGAMCSKCWELIAVDRLGCDLYVLNRSARQPERPATIRCQKKWWKCGHSLVSKWKPDCKLS